jgi:hypothetical protein
MGSPTVDVGFIFDTVFLIAKKLMVLYVTLKIGQNPSSENQLWIWSRWRSFLPKTSAVDFWWPTFAGSAMAM